MGKTAVVIKGDGIGPESVDSMLGILSECGFSSEIIMADAGSEQWEKNGRKDPTYILIRLWMLSSANACFKGPTTTIPTPNDSVAYMVLVFDTAILTGISRGRVY